MENITNVTISKAYDVKELLVCLKAAGLPIAEEAIESLGKNGYVAVKHWLKGSALVSENKIDDVVAAYIDNFDASVNTAVEKLDIDGDGK